MRSDVADALNAGVNGIEHGSFRDAIPAALFAQMKANGVYLRSDARGWRRLRPIWRRAILSRWSDRWFCRQRRRG